MEINLKSNIENFSLPLPIYSSIYIADVVSKDGQEFSIFVGLNKKYLEKLEQLSLDDNDVELQKNTNSGDKKRFVKKFFENWYQKNRTPFILVHKKTDALAALVWLGPESLFEDALTWHTVGWRSYNPFRGKGLMRNFTSFVMDFYEKNVKNKIKFWVAIKKENAGSTGLAESLGFQILEEASDDVSLVLVK